MFFRSSPDDGPLILILPEVWAFLSSIVGGVGGLSSTVGGGVGSLSSTVGGVGGLSSTVGGFGGLSPSAKDQSS